MGYGASIHHTLMEIHREFLDGNPVTKEQLQGLLEKHMHFPYAIETVADAADAVTFETIKPVILLTVPLAGVKPVNDVLVVPVKFTYSYAVVFLIKAIPALGKPVVLETLIVVSPAPTLDVVMVYGVNVFVS